uniref:Small G protein signaling modulator 2 n=1 Tax=Molossus molossus TaxID=27622 RepID=A0A7J8D1S4_MOLMO|nr:small G protein signaling modulator 2 [Molossus molossus]
MQTCPQVRIKKEEIKHPESGITPKTVKPREMGGATERSLQEPGKGPGTATRRHSRRGLVEGGDSRGRSFGSVLPPLSTHKILDSELFELMHQNGDYTHFYFCYRWFLLDFKRELLYEDVFAVWEVIWAAQHISSEHFVLFIALALVEAYREIIRDNNMDFTDIIKFFNERAEHHDAQEILRIARDLVHKVQMLIENK